MQDYTNLEGDMENVLEQNWFQAYTHTDHWDTIFWSKTDLLSGDDFKKWFLV